MHGCSSYEKYENIGNYTRQFKTTKSNPALPLPAEKANREFKAPAQNILWAADFTYVRKAVGFVYVAFIIDVVARYIVGWKASSFPNAQVVLDALNQALAARQPAPKTLIHYSNRGVQYVSITYTQRLEDAEIDPSVGRIGDNFDNAPFGRLRCNWLSGNGWQRRSPDSTRPRSSDMRARGKVKGAPNLPRSIGSFGSITNVVLAPYDTSLQHNHKGIPMTA
ncbi:MAG: transposase InsO family protein [Ascidiaceihabitans sp.]